jgi:LEA14-like dessication related protein
MKLYFVTFNRDNKIETLLKMTKSLTTAQECFLNSLKKYNPQRASLLLQNFSEEVLINDAAVIFTDGTDSVTLQLSCHDV